jgi:hypothetical protein
VAVVAEQVTTVRQFPQRFQDLGADNASPWRYRAYFPDGSYLCTNRQGAGLFRVAPGWPCEEWCSPAEFHAGSLLQFRLRLWPVLAAERERRAQRAGAGVGCGVCARACKEPAAGGGQAEASQA